MRKSEAKKKYEEAGKLHAAGRFADALVVFEELSRAFPKNADILYARALALGEVGRHDEAVIVCDMLTGIIEDPRAEKLKARVVAKREREARVAAQTEPAPAADEQSPVAVPPVSPEPAADDEAEAIEEVFPAEPPPAEPAPAPTPPAAPVPKPKGRAWRLVLSVPPRYRRIALAGTCAFIAALGLFLLWPDGSDTPPDTTPRITQELPPQEPALGPPEPVTLPPRPKPEPEPEPQPQPEPEPKQLPQIPETPAEPVVEAPAPPEDPPPDQPEAAAATQRVFRCPDDRAVGVVHIRDAVTGLNRSTVGPAKGMIVVPVGRELVLEIGAVDDEGLSVLAVLHPPELVTELVLTAPQVTDNDFAHIARLTGLRQLRLDSLTDFSGWGLARLADLPGLRRIELASIAIGSDTLAPLATFAALEELEVDICTNVAPDAFAPLANVPALAVLDITGCADASTPPLPQALCADLAKLTSLEELFIVSITEPALEELEAALPRCNITAMVAEGPAE